MVFLGLTAWLNVAAIRADHFTAVGLQISLVAIRAWIFHKLPHLESNQDEQINSLPC
jgi:hypothetical protein